MKKYLLFLLLAFGVLTCTQESFGQSGQLLKDEWHRECETLNKLYQVYPRRWGMRATVYNDPTSSNNGEYVLEYNRASTNRNDNGNWLKVADLNVSWGTGGGGSGFTTADNGLTANTATNVQLGGTFLKNTSITGSYNFDIANTTNKWGLLYNGSYLVKGDTLYSIKKFDAGGSTYSTRSNFSWIDNAGGMRLDKSSIGGTTFTTQLYLGSTVDGNTSQLRISGNQGITVSPKPRYVDINSYEIDFRPEVGGTTRIGSATVDGNFIVHSDSTLSLTSDIINLTADTVNITGVCIGCGGGGGTVTSVSGTANRITSTGGTTPVIDISASYVGQSSITTTGTLTSGSTGAGFTVALGTSTVSGALPEANLTAKYKFDQTTVSTAGGTVTLDMNSQLQRMFLGSATFATSKTIAFSNTTNSLVFNFQFEVTNVAGTLVFPANVVMSDVNWNTTTQTWTPPAIGQYECGGSWDGTNWKVKIIGPFN